MINYFLTNEKNEIKTNDKNPINEFKIRNNLFFDYSTMEINDTNHSQMNLIHGRNSLINTISLSNQGNNNDNCDMKNTQNNININIAINFKEKELRDIKIKLLTDYFEHIIKELYELEINKIQLSQKINSKELFSLFNIKNEFYINKDNFISVFSDYFNLRFSEQDFSYLIKKYDLDKDDKLNFEEFNFMISPISKIHIKENENNIQTNSDKINFINILKFKKYY